MTSPLLLTVHEYEFLVEILERMQHSLTEGLVHTEDAKFRDALKDREQIIAALLQKFKASSSLAFVTGQEVPA